MVSAPSSRNAPCPCGSGRRYKHCHGGIDSERPLPDAPEPLDAVRALLAQGKLVETVEACEAQIAVAGADVPTLRVLGEAVALLGDTDRILNTWHSILEVVPDDPEALFHLGSHALQNDDPDAAIAFFESALTQAPSHTGLRNNLGLAFEAAGRFSDAEQVFRETYETATNSFETVANLAQNLFQQRRFSDALQWYDRLVSRFDVAAPEIWANRAVCLHKLHDLEAAFISFERAFEADEASVQLYLDFGFLNIEMKRFDIANDALERSLALDPANVMARRALLFCRQSMANWQDFETNRAQLIDFAGSVDELPNSALNPFAFMTICDDPVLQKVVARAWVRKADKPTS